MHARKGFLCLGFGLFLLARANVSVAQMPQTNTADGLWTLVTYVDNSFDRTMPKQGEFPICIRPNGTWYSPAIPTWSGQWFQKGIGPTGRGNRVRLIGNSTTFIQDSFVGDFVKVDLMTGDWVEWVDDFSVLLWLRAELTRAAATCPPPPATAQISPGEAAEAAKHPPMLSAKDTKGMEDEAALIASAICGTGCPPGQHVVRVTCNVVACPGTCPNQAICAPNTGFSFTTCGSGCPAGYHSTRSTCDVVACPGSCNNQTVCTRN